jgi:hypothetical protein
MLDIAGTLEARQLPLRTVDRVLRVDPHDLGRFCTGLIKLYWRYKAGSQRAARDGDWKYLRIAGNEFLFDVVQDPRERANLKDREKGVFDRLKADWEAWNGTMLPERSRPANYTNAGKGIADRYGATNTPPPVPPPSAAMK